MQAEKYTAFLTGSNLSEKEIIRTLRIVEPFVHFLAENGYERSGVGTAKELLEAWSEKLIEQKTNTYKTYETLRKYCEWLEDNDLAAAVIEVCECDTTLDTLADVLKNSHGEDQLGLIFEEPVPPLGTSEIDRYTFTCKIMDNMSRYLTQPESQAAWFAVQHGIPQKLWKRHDAGEGKLFKKFAGIDEFLDFKHQQLVDRLTGLMSEGRMWYTQELDEEVLELVKSNKEIEVGRLDGDSIYVTKIPYQAKRYLHEDDPVLQRYHACHCPLVRESILSGDTVSTDICHCSLGHASHYVTPLNQPFRGEVLESVLNGDSRCRFVFHLANNSESK